MIFSLNNWIFRKDPLFGYTIERVTDGHIDFIVSYEDGTCAFNYPHLLPEYIKKKIRTYFKNNN